MGDTVIGAIRYRIFLRHIRPGTSLRLPIRADLANRFLGVQGDCITTLAVQALLHFILFVAPSPGGSGIAEIGTGALMAVVMPGHLLAPFTLAYRSFLQYLPAALGALVLLKEMHPTSGRTATSAVASGQGAGAVVGLRATAVLLAGMTVLPGEATAQGAADSAQDLFRQPVERARALVEAELEMAREVCAALPAK